MGPHHLHDHHHGHFREINPLAATISATSCCCNSSPCYTGSHQQHHHPSPPLPPPSLQLDQLLQLIVSYLQQRQCSGHTHFCTNSHQILDGCKRQCFQQQQLYRVSQLEEPCQQQEVQFVLSSLLKRIDALESSIQRFSASSDHRHSSNSSLRDAAARVIQTHFRAFLTRRSRTLRLLEELGRVKSIFHLLKSSVSGKTHFDFEVISQEAMDLLLKLDSIQGVDPMIRDGKRSLSRELVRFLEYVDVCAVKRHEIIFRAAKTGGSSKSRILESKSGDFDLGKKETVEKFCKRIEKIDVLSEQDKKTVKLERFKQIIDGGQQIPAIGITNVKGCTSKIKNGVLLKGRGGKSQVKKTVSFDKNGNVYRVYGNTPEPKSSGDDDSTDGSNDENGERTEKHYNELEGFKQIIDDGEKIPTIYITRGKGCTSKIRNGVLVKDSGGKSRVNKSVSFAENGNVYRVYGNTPEPSSNGDDDSTDGSDDENGERRGNRYNEVEEVKCVTKENDDDDEEAIMEDEGSSSQGSDEDAEIRLRRDEINRGGYVRNGNLAFSAPLPVKMEPRTNI